ncbi:DUF6898 family protein [Cohaesibacter celericrescens]|uniref:DUF6898 family protein n=1 Tax=Cohaesibacter celericrescens TaxID=2067669 RepID=UPI0035678BA9
MSAPKAGEVYIEFFTIGKQMKAVAVDAATGVEVTVFGPTNVSQKELQNLAVQKLKYRLGKLGHS